jgi:AcrR family transcriptional regulator
MPSRVADNLKVKRRELMTSEFEEIALDLFLSRGFHDVSVEEIAARAGVTARTFYRYFANKEDVLGLFMRRLAAQVDAALKQIPADVLAFDALRSVLVEVASGIDLVHLGRWLEAVRRDPIPFLWAGQSIFKAPSDGVWPLLERVPRSKDQQFHAQLAMATAQGAFVAAVMTWSAEGGDFVALVRNGLEAQAVGLSALGLATPPSRSRR